MPPSLIDWVVFIRPLPSGSLLRVREIDVPSEARPKFIHST
jgi:hypothetical protein